MRIHLSETSKLHCLAFGLPSWKTCPNKGEICKVACYAHYGMGRMRNVANVLENNLETVNNCDEDTLITLFLDAIPEKAEYFRWMWSGDCHSLKMFAVIHAVAKRRPQTKFWLSTRATYHYEFSRLENLVIRESSYRMNDARIHSGETTVLTPETACPEHVWECPGECGTCRVCWEFPEVPVGYRFHGSAVAQLRMKKYLREGSIS